MQHVSALEFLVGSGLISDILAFMEQLELLPLQESAPGGPKYIGVSARSIPLSLIFLFPVLCCSLPEVAAQTRNSPALKVRDHLHRAEVYLKANDRDSAARELNVVLAIDPKNTEAHTNLGVIAFSRHDCESASVQFRKALANDPSLIKIQALLGVCERKMGDPSARALLEKTFLKLTDEQLRLQVGLELAGLYDEIGDSGGTAVIMRTLVDLDPDNVDVLFMAHRVYSELADGTLNKLAVVAPGSARMQQVIAQHLVNGGELRGAIEHYKKALQIDPELSGVHFELGEAILQSARYDASAQADAQKEFELAVMTDGNTAKTECEFGSIAMAQSDLGAAFMHYQRAFQLNPNEIQAQLGLANVLMSEEKSKEAIKYLRMAVESEPLNGEAHYRLAQAYRRAQMPEQAKKETELVKEIKETKERVEALYHEMNIARPKTDEIPNEE